MKRAVLVACLLAIVLAVPRPSFAWGAAAHQMIMGRVIDLLPPELKPFYEHYRQELVLRSNDPDLWRNVPFDDEDPNHFIDFGIREYGKPPFTELPRDRGAALAKFGAANLRRWGTLPWRIEEMAGALRRAFEGMGRQGPYAVSDAVLFSAVLGHYVQDSTQPFHATDNFDGQLTGNNGIHSRFERDLIEKFGSQLQLTPQLPRPITGARDFAFDTLIHSYGLVDQILAADTRFTGSKEVYDEEYFEQLFVALKPMLEQQLSAAIANTAGLIVGAWELAGRPPLYTAQPRPPQRVRR
jgi:hypothetical protein